MLASAHALHLTTSYSCPSILGAFHGLRGFQKCSGEVQEFGSKSRTGASSRERGVEVEYEARSLE